MSRLETRISALEFGMNSEAPLVIAYVPVRMAQDGRLDLEAEEEIRCRAKHQYQLHRFELMILESVDHELKFELVADFSRLLSSVAATGRRIGDENRSMEQ